QDEINALQPYLSKSTDNQHLPEQLADLLVGQAFLCSNAFKPLNPGLNFPVLFQVGPRTIPHVRHLQKYLRAPLPAQKRFFFNGPDGTPLGTSAASLWEFRELLAIVPLDSLLLHQLRGDFENWIKNVFGDKDLAAQLNKLDRDMNGKDLRQALRELVIRRYDELENLM
ncbi:MAG: hypothetical protein NT121_10155, partial [Chloroflexi bacterium]|nr:hypothetical protein [Chloroflexota bacterium]